jgi:hypothetical protein
MLYPLCFRTNSTNEPFADAFRSSLVSIFAQPYFAPCPESLVDVANENAEGIKLYFILFGWKQKSDKKAFFLPHSLLTRSLF